MDRKVIAYLAVFLLMFSLAAAMNTSAGMTINKPNPTVGDYLLYEANGTNEIRMEFEKKGVTKNGHDCFEMKTSVEVDVMGTKQTVTTTTWLRSTDLAQVAGESTVDMMGMKVHTDMSWDPPVLEYKYPMTVGSKWSVSSTLTTKSVIESPYGNINTTDTQTVSTNVEIVGEAKVTVKAGTFDTLKLEVKETGGTTSYHYISAKVGWFVKVTDENDTTETELTDYKYQNPGSGGGGGNGDDVGGIFGDMLMLMVIVVVIILVVVIAVVAVVMKKRRSAPPPMQPGAPPAGQQPVQDPYAQQPAQPQDPYAQQPAQPQDPYAQQPAQPQDPYAQQPPPAQPQYEQQQYQQPPPAQPQYEQQPPQQQYQQPPKY